MEQYLKKNFDDKRKHSEIDKNNTSFETRNLLFFYQLFTGFKIILFFFPLSLEPLLETSVYNNKKSMFSKNRYFFLKDLY